MSKKPAVIVGDVFQILTSKGICYGLITHRHKKWGWVVSIFREFFPKTPKDFTEVVAHEPQFITTFLINHAVQQGLFSVVANVEIPSHLAQFPIFRGTNNLRGDDTMWFFWDGEKEWKVHRPLTDDEKRYPEGPSLPSAPLLIEMIEKNYRAEKDYV